ncbi:methylaspartate mutase [Marinobacter shengliensis]
MNFANFIRRSTLDGELAVQPRMGVTCPDEMRRGLRMVSAASAASVGTITVDSYTRTGNFAYAARAIAQNHALNGYPIATHSTATTQRVVEGIQGESFPIQVRHGSATPFKIIESLIAAGLDATEGGPVSYCLPYGRVPLENSIYEWRRSCELIASVSTEKSAIHLESFGGCMLGQLCPPSMLLAISTLECMFFATYGVRSLSLSYTQQTSFEQDEAALHALRRLAEHYLGGVDWHIVLYAYMGVFPFTELGSKDLQRSAISLAHRGKVERLIVKTVAEAKRIPTFEENIEALEASSRYWREERNGAFSSITGTTEANLIFDEARLLIEETLALDSDLGAAMLKAFGKGLLDIPYCLHPSNSGETSSYIDSTGRIVWGKTGKMPISSNSSVSQIDPFEFLSMLSFTRSRFDAPYLEQDTPAYIEAKS